MTRTQEGWINAYKVRKGLWMHDNDVRRPHVIMTSGLHTNGYFDSEKIEEDDNLLRDAARDLIEMYTSSGACISKINGVAGPQKGEAKLAKFICDHISSLTEGGCFHMSPYEPEKGAGFVLSDQELCLLDDNPLILPCDDVLSTGQTEERMIGEIALKDATILPYILALVNRSGQMEINGRKIFALINIKMPMWTPRLCPLCRMGSEAVRPEGNWDRLIARY